MTETTKDKVPSRSGRGKCEYRSPTDVERVVLGSKGFSPWAESSGVQATWERDRPSSWVVGLWAWEDGSTDLDAWLQDRASGTSVRVAARNIVALFALMERFGDVIWDPTGPA